MGGTVYGGSSVNNNANDNTVSLTNTGVTGDAFGGASFGGGNASGNKLSFAGATAGGDLIGGYSGTGNANDNGVTLGAGAVTTAGQSIYGGWAFTAGSEAKNNTVTIDGGNIKSSIYGGYVDSVGAAGTTTGNTVKVNGGTFATGIDILGGSGTNFTGNTLVTQDITGISINSISNFEKYIFNVSTADVSQTVYTVAVPTDLTDTKVTVNFTGNDTLKVGDHINLFSQTTGVVTPDTLTLNDRHGSLIQYDTKLDFGGGSELRVDILGARAADDTQTIGQAHLTSLQLVNMASDHARNIAGMLDQGYLGTFETDMYGNSCEPAPGRLMTFAAIEGGTSRWNTGFGSRTSLDHVSTVAGLGFRSESFMFAGYFEGGRGWYDAKFGGVRYVDNEKTEYLGGGILARFSRGGFYAEAGGHIGRTKTDYSADLNAIRTDFKIKSAYFGADAVLGYQAAAGSSVIDFSARYSWNRSNGDDAVIDGNRLRLDDVDSHRVRAGAKWAYAGSGSVHPYAGAYFEYEFDGKSSGRIRTATDVFELRQAKMRGASGIGEVGLRFGRPDSRFTADIGAEGYVGKRRGVTGKALVGWSF